MLRLFVVWLHVVAATAWVGGILYASHLVVPAAARGGREALAVLVRARVVAWAAFVVLVLTGLENIRHLLFASPWLAAKLVLVLGMLSVAAHRDFAVLPRAVRAIEAGSDPSSALRGVRALDRVALLLSLAVLLLAVGVARGR